MKITIGSTSIEITSCFRKRDTQRGFYLDITIPKESIGMEELYNLLDGNTETILVDGNIYIGFKEIGSFSVENGSYKVAQICTSEYEAQLSIAQSKIAEQDAIIAGQNAIIAEQNETLNALLGLEG